MVSVDESKCDVLVHTCSSQGGKGMKVGMVFLSFLSCFLSFFSLKILEGFACHSLYVRMRTINSLKKRVISEE